ncbi:MAG TPA: ribbon-helix-helix protein, CopG family [Acidimicrobiia bacterium]|nr:ribbon-helix-helix protein, CopG family [Acidimicrobiia bacterium]
MGPPRSRAQSTARPPSRRRRRPVSEVIREALREHLKAS